MTPQRLAIKLFASPDPSAAVDLHPFIGLFHRLIQQRSVEGLLIDVADYAHVPEGPGVLLVGHDVDYGLDLGDGEAGLLTTRKRYEHLSLGEVFRDTLRRAVIAARAIEADDAVSIRFGADAPKVQLLDRIAAPNTSEAFESAAKEIEPVAVELFGDGCTVERADADDERRPLALRLRPTAALDLDGLAARFGGEG